MGAILDEDTWQACNAKLAANRTVRRSDDGSYPIDAAHRGNTAGRRYLLTGGVAVCGVCTAPLAASMKQLKNMLTVRRRLFVKQRRRRGGALFTWHSQARLTSAWRARD